MGQGMFEYVRVGREALWKVRYISSFEPCQFTYEPWAGKSSVRMTEELWCCWYWLRIIGFLWQGNFL